MDHNERLAAIRALVEQNERINTAFYVDGKAAAMRAAMEGQRDTLRAARAALRALECENDQRSKVEAGAMIGGGA